MGIYDFVGKENIQIKCTSGNRSFKAYDIGNDIPLSNGLYLGHEGWFVVFQGRVLATGEAMFDKWGGVLSCSYIIKGNNPVAQTINVRKEKIIRKV